VRARAVGRSFDPRGGRPVSRSSVADKRPRQRDRSRQPRFVFMPHYVFLIFAMVLRFLFFSWNDVTGVDPSKSRARARAHAIGVHGCDKCAISPKMSDDTGRPKSLRKILNRVLLVSSIVSTLRTRIGVRGEERTEGEEASPRLLSLLRVNMNFLHRSLEKKKSRSRRRTKVTACHRLSFLTSHSRSASLGL